MEKGDFQIRRRKKRIQTSGIITKEKASDDNIADPDMKMVTDQVRIIICHPQGRITGTKLRSPEKETITETKENEIAIGNKKITGELDKKQQLKLLEKSIRGNPRWSRTEHINEPRQSESRWPSESMTKSDAGCKSIDPSARSSKSSTR